ncbi:MAG: hypothetical protein WAK55_15990 [Xanthobacteraceae bacterium]
MLMNKAQYDRVVAYIRLLQATHTTWSVELYNCNAFVADIGRFTGLRVPSSSWINPRIFVNNLRKINTGHPEAANERVSDNVKEMSSPTRDGHAMIAAGLIHPDTQGQASLRVAAQFKETTRDLVLSGRAVRTAVFLPNALSAACNALYATILHICGSAVPMPDCGID